MRCWFIASTMMTTAWSQSHNYHRLSELRRERRKSLNCRFIQLNWFLKNRQQWNDDRDGKNTTAMMNDERWTHWMCVQCVMLKWMKNKKVFKWCMESLHFDRLLCAYGSSCYCFWYNEHCSKLTERERGRDPCIRCFISSQEAINSYSKP